MIKSFLFVGLGGSLGAILRYFITTVWKTENFPFHTLSINITGCFFIGIVFALSEKTNLITENTKLFLATGICGGFTTFSAFSLENFQLLKTGEYLTAGFYILTSLAACIMATFIGFKIINN